VAIGNTVRFTGLPLEDVLPMASTRPAEYLGLANTGKVVAEWDPTSSTLRVRRVES
jgi:N-acetylglucosamine-6-phosphate deacetylase